MVSQNFFSLPFSVISSVIMQSLDEFRKAFNEAIKNLSEEKGLSSVLISRESYNAIVERLTEIANSPGEKKSSKDYRLMNRYELYSVSRNAAKKLRKKGTLLRYLSNDDLFDAIHTAHISSGHGARDISHNKTKISYANITKEIIQIYVNLCESCNLKKSRIRKSLVVKPILSNEMNSRCQVDLIDFQSEPDNDYKFVLNYQDHLTKFCILRPLYTKTAKEVSVEVLEIFCTFGNPHILQSDNGREFANKVVEKIIEKWPGCKIVHGKPRHSQSQGSVERANRDVEAIIACWLRDNKSRSWSTALPFVQYQKNNRLHSGIGRTPYEAMFGKKGDSSASASLPDEVWSTIETEEDLERAVNQLNAGKNNLCPSRN